MFVARHFFSNHLRLALTIAAGAVTVFALPSSWQLATRLLIGWNVTVWAYLFLMSWLLMRAGHARVLELTKQEDESWAVVLIVMSIASIASLGAIILVLAQAKSMASDLRLVDYAFTVATVLGSWCLLGVLFTQHYARLFYRSPSNRRPLRFPDDEASPNYWDFLYFSFTVSVAVQTSDVAVMTRAARKMVLTQSVLFFLFNLAILGLSINVAAGLIGS